MRLVIALVVPTVTTPNETSDDGLIIEARSLFNKLNQTTTRRNIADVRDEMSKEASRLEKLAARSNNPKAKFYIYKACDLFCVIYKTAHDRLPYLEKMIDIIEDDGAELTEREKALTRFKLADVLYDENRIGDAYNYICKLYTERPEIFKNLLSGFHILFETSILLKKFDFAENILDKEFKSIIESHEEPFTTFALLNYTKLYLHKGDYDKAIESIIKTKKIQNRALNTLQEVQVRIYENMYFFFTGDMEFAKQLLIINMKFCDHHKIGDRSPEAIAIFKVMNACLEAQVNDKPLSKESADSLEHFQKGNVAIFGVLLKRIAEQAAILK